MNQRFSTLLLLGFVCATLFGACDKPTGTVTILAPGMASAPPHLPGPGVAALPAQITDRQGLAGYQAAFPAYAAALAVQPKAESALAQVADRQALASYQAALTVGSVK